MIVLWGVYPLISISTVFFSHKFLSLFDLSSYLWRFFVLVGFFSLVSGSSFYLLHFSRQSCGVSFPWCAQLASSDFSKFSFMGVSNSGVFLTEKDLNSIGFNFLAKPTLEFLGDECGNCETARSADGHGHGQFDKKQEEKEREEEKCTVKLTTATELKTPPQGEFKKVEDDDDDDDDDNDGFKTPTALGHKIPLFLQCPPAPRKPKPLPSAKRRAPGPNRRVLLDLSNEIQSLFPSDLGGKRKRLRQAGN